MIESMDGNEAAIGKRRLANRPVVVAHRAANLDADSSVPENWSGRRADVVEADVHWFRGRIEVRHSKALWPTSFLYEDRRLVPRPAARPTFARVIDALPSGPQLWVDLKGPDPRLSRGVKVIVGDDGPLWVSARCWWQLAPFRTRPNTQTFMSVGSPWQRSLATRALSLGWSDGIVIHERLADPTFLSSIAASAPIVAWAVQDRARARSLLGQGAAGLIIDSAKLLSQVRADIAADRRYASRL